MEFMNGKHGIMLENSCQIMSYMCDVIMALKLTINNDSSARASSPFDGENVVDTDNDYWIDEINDEDSAGEDSDDDSLCNKLCTYSQTQKEFVFQHWYNCHTCRMVDGSGVCTICAKVCHADHDVTYSKHGSFFCDCGAKEDGSCRAMTKRSPREANNEPSRKYDENLSNLSIMRHQSSSPPLSSHQNVSSQQAVSSSQPSVSTNSGVESKREDDTRVNLSVKLSQWKDELSSQIEKNNILKKLLEMLECLLPVIEFNRVKHSYIVRLADINKAFQVLHTEEKKYDHNDQLMLPTLGSQEGAFENVQMNYSGDQAQTIRHLMTGHMIRRVVMCCISTGVSGKKQHLAVSHEKGKITILQLSALLKQADSSQKKLTLTRLASTPVPFSVLSIVSNPRNEDFLAVSGLKDCHVLTFNPSGTVSDHLVLHPQLEASNYIIKAIWVPGSQTELALVTSDFVKIYDLSVDVLSPQHYFLVPSGKVRDCTLSFMEDGTRYVLIMSSGGHIYVQSLTEESSALNGPFYVTNIMDVDHPEIKHSSSERIGDGGVSIYYCHTLQLLVKSCYESHALLKSNKKPPRKLKKNQQNKRNGAAVGTSSQGSSLAFPIDFFESCSTISEVEFNGNDVLQVYNVNQIKYRLTTSGLYIANMMPTGFSMEVTNNDSNQVMVGIRVMLGAQDISRVPSYIEIFGRCIPVSLTLNRWFDLPFTREESLLADKKMTIVFGPSLDTSGVSIIDSIQVYGKTKEAFGWPEDVEESSSTNQEPSDLMDAQPLPLTPLDKLIASILELLEGCFALGGGDLNENFKNEASGLSTQMDFAVMKHVTKHIFESGKEQKESDEATSIDIESYIRLVLTTRSIAIARPLNLVKFAETRKENDQKLEEKITFINYLSNTFWSLIESKTANSVVGKIGQSGITHVESLVHALVDIFHAFINSDVDMISSITKLYTDFLLSKNIQVSFACKQALVRILRPRVRRRRVYAPSPDRCPSPGEEGSNNNNNAPIAEEIRQFDPGFPPPVLSNSGGNNNRNGRSNERIHSRQNENLNLGPGGIPLGGVAGNMDAMLPLVNNNNDGNNGNIPPVLDLPPEVDDEAMVELAIALSLQEQGGELNDVPQVIQVIPNYGLNEFSGLQGLIRDTIAAVASIHDPNSESGEQVAPLRESNPTPNNPMSGNSQQREAGHYSDTTPSAPGSDDESTAAMDGSTLRTPPIEIDPDNGPGSGAGSESGASAVESIIGDPSGRSSAYEGEGINAKTELANNIEVEWESNNAKLHSLRVTLLDHLLGYLPNLRDIGGVRCIPCKNARENALFNDKRTRSRRKNKIVARFQIDLIKKELQLVILRLFGVLMSRSKTWQSSQPDGLNYVSSTTASTLLSSGIVNYCLKLLKSLLTYWKESTVDENTNKLLTEMALRIPYHATKIFENGGSSNAKENWEEWHYSLCEYMMLHQTLYARRQVRRLLLYICGTKDRYRELRDLHTLESHMTSVREIIRLEITTNSKSLDSVPHLSFPYDTLLKLIEHLRACVDIATSHTNNWQKFYEGVNPIVLQLLQSALCGANQKVKYFSSSSKKKYKGDHDGDGECNSVSIVSTLVKQINSPSQLLKFIETFLLECNSTSVRWQAHSILVTIHRNSDQSGKEDILNIMWKLWSKLPYFGRKASQFVDLLGYFSMKTLTKEDKLQDHVYVSKAIAILKSQNEILSNHPNANIYSSLSQLVDFNGYYLESDPCLVCNNPEVPNRALKLSALKIDTKYTTSSQIVKLSCSHSIGKINLRIGDLKRQKMVRVINIYYNNKSVQAVVELKNRSTIWHKAKKVTLSPGQTDIKVEFPLPIIACNLRIEYTDFYENIQASAETLQCPRCSTSVPANPGVCTNCGENVFQCHKCRSINYDEKDPFLCNACGFCKYAKFEYTLNTRPCCAVDPIENEDDYKKAVTSINSLLEKADKVYRNLISNKPSLENLLAKITESVNDKHPGDGAIDSFSTTASTSVANAANTGNIGTTSSNAVSSSTGSSSSNHVNQYIQTLASKYCSECKGSFEDLSKIIQKVMATRKELVSFENARKAKYVPGGTSKSPSTVGRSVSSGKCYGCAAATVEHCLTLLRALASKVRYRNELYQQGLIKQLMEYNLRRGTSNIRLEVRKLICLITRDNLIATNHLNKLIFSKIGLAVKGRISCPEIVESVRHEMSLLAATVSKEDSCWEVRLRCVLRIFILAIKQGGKTSPTVMECITLPCLKIIQGLVRPKGTFKSKSSVMDSSSYIQVDDWLKNKPGYHFEDWENKLSIVDEKATKDDSKNVTSSRDAKNTYLIEKYFKKWVSIVRENKNHPKKLESTLLNASWLKSVLFNSSSQMARQVGCNMVEGFCSGKRRLNIIDLLTSFLEELGTAGESASEYVQLYQKLIADEQVKYYLAVKGVLKKLADLISKEIDNLDHMEQTTLNSDLAQGFALKTLTEILSSFVSVDQIKNKFKGRLISTVLQGYLSLRRLVVQRTKLVDQTQDKLLELLEIMTTGTKAESEAFMAVCVETIKRYPVHDQLTPKQKWGEFFMTLDKDPQQEDFLQGRMLGNPYSSNDPDLGPLMRNVKNKICADCELVALLEDDNGMELLVHNKIVSLDLLVKDVYQKIWAPEANEGDPMKVIYRMRGLLGDATEEFIETLDNKEGEDKDEEEVYKMAGIMAECGGLEVMLERLASIHDVQYSKPLLLVLLKLFSHSIRLKVNREKLLNPTYKTIPLLLNCLKLSLSDSNSSINEMILEAMERLLVEAAAGNSISNYCQFASNCVSTEDIQALLKHAVNLRSGTALHSRLMRVLPFLTYGNDDKMELLLSHFSEVLEFDKFDIEHGADEDSKMETFVAMCDGIERNKIGNTMKDLMVKSGIMNQCIEYIKVNAPASKTVLLKADDPFWKAFVTKPSLKYILRAMAGLAAKHPTTQLAVSSECISILHQMEQVSSDEHVGSLAESVLEAIKSHPDAFTKVVEVRQRTKAEKKKLAMAMRAKQLKAIGLKANDRGQVKAENSILQQFVEIAEESGLSFLAIYTYTKDCHLEEFESASRKQMGYSTVTHFNLVHVDCHLAAVRQARSRDEWDSALLQNANTKCNGLLPLWGPQVVESAYASSLARHNNYLAEATQHRDIGYHSTVHDLKLLLLRFAEDKSFSNESGGGGPQSNMHLVPYLMHMALYVLNTTRAASREEMNLNSFLDQPKNQWVDTGYIPDGPIYYTVIALLVFSPSSWKSVRIKLLQRLLLTAHTRSADPNHTGGNSLVDKEVKEYNVYKKMVLFFALIDQLYSVVFCNVPTDKDSWPVALSEWIRHNDDTLTKSTLKLLNVFQEDLVPASSVVEIADVCRLLEDIPTPASFLSDVLNSIP
ncbi:UBR4 [Lepeophtheirus salmonis]|uniref:UBR4 n=1 Tax=Lepeophtheirus salmonis TaxID=72036 RepID=A0A7R8H6Q3_LEPSM|nr:UBR4 [Lepeophtheirus salmonis]CAF2906379.1 UBR4 [Lepeophtheirus salmonis]